MTTFLNFWGAACEISCYITCLSKRWNTPFFSHFKANPTLASFVLGKIKQKLQMIRQQCLPLPKNLVHLGEEDSAITGTSTLAVPQTSLSSLLALQCPDWALLNFSSSFVSKISQTTKMRPVTCYDDLDKRGDFILLLKALLPSSLAGVSNCSCQVLPSQRMP